MEIKANCTNVLKLPGDYKYHKHNGNIVGLVFCCPCGCGEIGQIPFGVKGWSWDGNLETPTLTPSIQKTTDCKWHGYLTNGIFKTV